MPQRASQTVLDVVTWIQQNADPTLSYRYACRVGMCGSCAMMVNGQPRWTCRTHVDRVTQDGRLEIAPLRNLPVIKDLAAGHVRRMGVIERDDKWVVLCDLPPEGRPAFAAALQEAWTAFQESRTP